MPYIIQKAQRKARPVLWKSIHPGTAYSLLEAAQEHLTHARFHGTRNEMFLLKSTEATPGTTLLLGFRASQPVAVEVAPHPRGARLRRRTTTKEAAE